MDLEKGGRAMFINSRRIKTLSVAIVLIFTISFASCSTVENLPKGEFVRAYDSPSSNFTINIYLCNSGATTDYAIRGELIDNLNAKKKNIYWGYHEDKAYVYWLDEENVVINGRTLNVLHDVYDFRNE